MTAAPTTLAGRAHPFTPFLLALSIAIMAVAAPGPGSAISVYAATIVLVVVSGTGRAALRALIPLAPIGFFLFLLHAVMGPGDRQVLAGISVSREGLVLAATQAARLGAIATASLALHASFSPSRFVDAMAERGGSFSAAYLVVATLLALPRFRARAVAIVDAQRSRGLRLRGNPINRVRAIGPVTFPLLLGALAEVDERGFALETRCAGAVGRRTPLAPPGDTPADRLVRALALAAALGVVAWRLFQ